MSLLHGSLCWGLPAGRPRLYMMESLGTRSGGRTRELVSLVAILVIAAAVRSIGLFKHATMPDEAFTFFISAHPLPQIVTLLKTGDFHPPLLYLIGHALFTLTSRAYLFRALSVAFGAAGVAATYAVASRIAPRYALFTAFLVALCPALVFFDRFFRMYAMLWSLCMLSWAVLLWALSGPRSASRWLLYALTLTCLLYTQYLAFFTLAAQLIYMFCFHRKTAGVWLAFAAAGVAFLPWLPVLVQQYPLGGSAYEKLRGHWDQMFMAPPILLVHSIPPRLEYSWITAGILWLLLAGGIAIAASRKQWVALALVSPVVLQVFYSAASGKLLLGQRYLLQGIAPMVLLIVLVIEWLSATRARALAIVACAILTTLMLAGTVDELFLAPYQPIDWIQYSRFLDARMRPGDAIVMDGSMTYYVLIGSKAVTHRPVFLVDSVAELPSIVKAVAPYPRVWYVDYQSSLPDPKHAVFEALLQTHKQRTSWKSTEAGYNDELFTTLFERPAGAKRGP